MFLKNTLIRFIFNNLLVIFLLLFLLEVILQITFKFENKITTQPILFYNPYCEQNYWYNIPDVNIDRQKYIEHPILSFIDKKHEMAYNLEYEETSDNYNYVFYGSSFIGHELFNKYINDNNIQSINYALPSYGLGQISLSYKLTASLHKNNKIVIGFLLEDLDRVVMHKRNYNKIKYVIQNEEVKLVNSPVNLNKIYKPKPSLYSLKFIKNVFHLYNNGFDPRLSKCRMEEKQLIFDYLIKNIKKISKENNQELKIILFNYLNDLEKEPSWRYNYIKKTLEKYQIDYTDSIKIFRKNGVKDLSFYKDFYGADLHYNYLGFKKILDYFFKL